MATAQNVIENALRKLGVLASGEGANAEELADGLTALNQMLLQWNTDRLDIYAIRNDVFNLSNGVQAYTLGTGGTLNATRPVSIKNAFAITAAGLSLPMEILASEDWAAIVEKTVSGTVPRKMYCDFAYPLANVYIWPVPSGTPQLSLYSWQQFTSYPSLGTTVDLPPGYEVAIVYNLAVKLSPEYGRPVTQEVAAEAAATLGSLRMLNRPPVQGAAEEQMARAQTAGAAPAMVAPQAKAPVGQE